MNPLNCKPPVLCEEVLLMVLQHLDARDLARCEAVCRHWREVILSGRPWRKWLNNKRTTLPELRQLWQEGKLGKQNIPLEDYKYICQFVLQYLKEQNNNWHTGRCVRRILQRADYRICDLSKSDYGIVVECDNHEIKFLDTTTMQVTTTVHLEGYLAKVEKNVAIFRSQEGIKFIDCNDGHVINELLLTDDLIMNKYCFNGKIMVAYSLRNNCVKVWRVKSYSDISFVKDSSFNCLLSLAMDDQYILIQDSGMIYFMCTKTFQIERTLAPETKNFAYEGGLLFIIADYRRIRIWDVASETYFNDLYIPSECYMRMSLIGFSNNIVTANSKYLVVNCASREESKWLGSTLCVYDLEAVKNRSSPSNLPHSQIQIRSDSNSVLIDGTQIVSLGINRQGKRQEITILDFNPVLM